MLKRLWHALTTSELPSHSHDPGYGHNAFDRPDIVTSGIAGTTQSLRSIATQTYAVYQLGNGYLLATEFQQTVFCADVEALTDTIKGIELRRSLESQAKQGLPGGVYPTPIYSNKQQP